jgi:hypothetical protein
MQVKSCQGPAEQLKSRPEKFERTIGVTSAQRDTTRAVKLLVRLQEADADEPEGATPLYAQRALSARRPDVYEERRVKRHGWMGLSVET